MGKLIDVLYAQLVKAAEDDDFANGDGPDGHEVTYVDRDAQPPHTFMVQLDSPGEGQRDFQVTIKDVTRV